MRRYGIFLIILLFAITACGAGSGSSSTGSSSGSVNISMSDAPGDFDHVWITVKSVWFHTSNAAGPDDAGWLKYDLSSPVSIDLESLSGKVSSQIWSGLTLPDGNYQQIRLFLVPTENALAQSASSQGLSYNNEAVVNGTAYPLRIPTPDKGIKLSGTFGVAASTPLNLALEFDVSHDVISFTRDSITEYVLKPDLQYFDLDNAAAIVGQLDPGAIANAPNARFIIKAEQVDQAGDRFVIRRVAALQSNGSFILYPLWPGTYDVMIRGIGYDTAIVQNVPAVKGTTPASSPTNIGQCAMVNSPAPDFAVGGTVVPTGSWADFEQTVPGMATPYVVRYRHFNPFTGTFSNFLLSSGPLQVAPFNNGGNPAFANTVPAEGTGNFQAVARAYLYDPSTAFIANASSAEPLAFGTLAPASGTANQVSGNLLFASNVSLFNGVTFVTQGGIIVNALYTGAMSGSTWPYAVGDLPGNFAGARYHINALAWNPGLYIGAPSAFDLINGTNASGVDVQMKAQ